MCDMARWVGRVALVTGASTGIGAAVASALVKHGMTVVGCSRHPEKIEELSKTLSATSDIKGKLFAQKCDVRKEEEVLELFKSIKENHGGVDVCVNNAGLAHNSSVLTGEVDQWRDMLEINVLGLALCTREAVKSMREKKVNDGHIFNVSSMSGHRITRSSGIHFYSATKFAVTALTESTRQELRDLKSNIRITQISPAVVETPFMEKLYGEEKSQKMYRSMKCLESENIADTVVFSLSCPPHMQIHDMLIRPTEQVT